MYYGSCHKFQHSFKDHDDKFTQTCSTFIDFTACHQPDTKIKISLSEHHLPYHVGLGSAKLKFASLVPGIDGSLIPAKQSTVTDSISSLAPKSQAASKHISLLGPAPPKARTHVTMTAAPAYPHSTSTPTSSQSSNSLAQLTLGSFLSTSPPLVPTSSNPRSAHPPLPNNFTIEIMCNTLLCVHANTQDILKKFITPQYFNGQDPACMGLHQATFDLDTVVP
ncbi:hypothetical protein FRB95_014142 [Tulasnella sp. JGI-2019a]|nr:hypothetical protein FRB95_014142 [Tulasnella sp. JGI-2019a]